jgi:hypothetical protein
MTLGLGQGRGPCRSQRRTRRWSAGTALLPFGGAALQLIGVGGAAPLLIGVGCAAPLLIGVGCAALLLIGVGCAAPLPLSGELARVEALAARHHGAAERACAPEELASADAQLRFARLELGLGNTHRAREHLALAELNTRAARILTREVCAPAGDDGLRLDPLRSDAMQHRAPSHASRPSITTLGRLREPGALGAHAAQAADNQPAPPRPGA